MAEEKRPVLSLKRKPAENSTAPAEATPAPGVVRRKKVVVVSSPPAWKAKKAKLEKAKQAAEADARNAAPAPDKAVKTPPPVRYLRRHCCKVSDEAAFCLIQRPYISKTLLTRRISPRGSP